MTNDISPLSAVQDNIKEKIKAEFVNLIPDEMWTAMVCSVVADFTSDVRKNHYGHETGEQISPFKKIIRDEIEATIKASLKAKLDEVGAPRWGAMGERVMSDAMKKMIEDHFEALLVSVNAGMVQMTVMSAVNNLRNSMMV
ncbi:hypothetical protein J5288_08495 [Agrobacterium sp. S2/73]|uniref:hypothetical protein n=1 Tax=unclassified Agrobacterium TaxID=2632611 RepID=UPI001ADB605E|nr:MULTISPECIES: hypothetical protein [unclassified Agrobacterium]MBO9108740.1 hypothetical protein [Agrobacterium sp. S2/73]QXZ73502.1 hypothetical protein J5276_06015 [Agrobacterium sp. S7/73]